MRPLYFSKNFQIRNLNLNLKNFLSALFGVFTFRRVSVIHLARDSDADEWPLFCLNRRASGLLGIVSKNAEEGRLSHGNASRFSPNSLSQRFPKLSLSFSLQFASRSSSLTLRFSLAASDIPESIQPAAAIVNQRRCSMRNLGYLHDPLKLTIVNDSRAN